jgi:hypothetical protein
MSAGTSDALAIVGVLAVFGTIAIVLRERLRPELSSDWSERDFGDQPEIPVFHVERDTQ